MSKVQLPVQMTCQNCKKRVSSTRTRNLRLKDYEGPCGDSFCYASCIMSSCREVSMKVCDACASKLSKKVEPVVQKLTKEQEAIATLVAEGEKFLKTHEGASGPYSPEGKHFASVLKTYAPPVKKE